MTEPTPPPPAPIAKLAAALARVQADLPEVDRDRTVEVTQKNGQTYSYSYVTLAALTKKVLPLLAKHGLSYIAMPGAGSDGKGMSVRYRLMHESGEFLEGEFPISGEGGIQMIGGRITYARRYCLAALVGVAADEDDESRLSEDGGPRTAQRAPAKPRGKAQPAPAARPAASRPAGPSGAPPLPGEEGEPAGREVQRATPPADEPARGRGGLITEPMTRKLAITMKQALGDDASVRKQFIVDMIGRDVASSKELTFDEGRALIDAFEKANQDPDTAAATVIDIYRRTTGGEQAASRQSVAEQTRASVVGAPAGPDDEPPAWADGP